MQLAEYFNYAEGNKLFPIFFLAKKIAPYLQKKN